MEKIKNFINNLNKTIDDTDPFILFLQKSLIIILATFTILKILVFINWSWYIIMIPLYVFILIEIIAFVLDYNSNKARYLSEKYLDDKRLYFVKYDYECESKQTDIISDIFDIAYGMNVVFILVSESDDEMGVKILHNGDLIQCWCRKLQLGLLKDLRCLNIDSNKQLFCDSIDNFLIEKGINYLSDELGVY